MFNIKVKSICTEHPWIEKPEFVTWVAFKGKEWWLESRKREADFLLDALLYFLNFKPCECITY